MTVTARHIHGALAAAALSAAFAAPAQATPTHVSAGHWDIAAEYDCDTGEVLALHAHNHDEELELELEDTVFDVGSATTSAAPWNGVFAGAVRFIDPTETSPEYIVGVDVEYVGEAECDDEVVFTASGTTTTTVGARVAGFVGAQAPDTVFDTETGAGENGGIETDTHVDLFWGFTHGSTTYELPISAEPATGGSPVTETLTFEVA
jgi:hypothetical protein